MAIDGKYGRVTLEHGTIGDDEPVIVFRAKDKLTPELLMHYRIMCAQAGSPQRHLDLIEAALDRFELWQSEHLTKVPDSESSRAWMS
jgi:hypothetical protein